MKDLCSGLFCFLLFALSGYTQNNESFISGMVKDEQNQSIVGATVRLIHPIDSTIISGEITDLNGKFKIINLPNGNFILNASAIGYHQCGAIQLHISATEDKFNLPVIILISNKKTLNEVTISAKRPLVERDIDKTIVNVDAMIGSATNHALDILEKSPGVTVSTLGDISLNGKGGVLVLLDGRSTYLSSQDLAFYFKSIPGSIIDKIELMDNPPAKYEAGGSAIINIKLKKTRLPGMTGNISSGTSFGIKARSYQSVNLNLNRKKINLFANFGYSLDGNQSKETNERSYSGPVGEIISSVNLQNNNAYTSKGWLARIGMDYNYSPKTIFGIQFNVQTRPRQEVFVYRNKRLNNFLEVDSTTTGSTTSGFDWNTFGVNLNFNHQFTAKGKEINADFNFIQYNSTGTQLFNNAVYLLGNVLTNAYDFNYDLLSDIHIYNIKADYVQPLKHKIGLEAGLKSSFVINDNDSRYFNKEGSGLEQDFLKSNHFIFHENINAAYISAKKNGVRWGSQMGLRMENTEWKGDQQRNIVVEGTTFNRSITGIFPSAYISYKLDSLGKHTAVVSIARRINRPNYQIFNPFKIFRDNYSYATGNPDLDPQYQIRADLRYQFGSAFSLSLQYGRFSNLIFQTTHAEEQLFVIQSENVGNGRLLNTAINISIHPVSWWFLNSNLQYGQFHIEGMVSDGDFFLDGKSARLNVMNQFSLPKEWSAELSGYYNNKDFGGGQAVILSRYRINGAVQKKLFNNNGSIKFTIEDIFHSWKQRENLIGLKDISSHRITENDTQRIGLAFSYRFGNVKYERKRKHSDNAADAEKGRAE